MTVFVASGLARLRITGNVAANASPSLGVAPSPTTIALTGSDTAIVNVALRLTFTIDVAATSAITITPTIGGGGVGVPATPTIAVGQTTTYQDVTWPASGGPFSYDFTVSPTLTRTGRPKTIFVSTTDGLPGWVPSTLFSAALVPMTNTLDSVNTAGPWWNNAGGNSNTLFDFSGGAYNAYSGTYGSIIVHGGGHSANNNNGVFVANLDTLTWQVLKGPTDLRLTSPSRWVDYMTGSFGIDTNSFKNSYDYFAYYGPNSTGWATPTNSAQWEFPATFAGREANWGEYVPGEPMSDHTYGNLQILTPEGGGDPLGTLFRAPSQAGGALTPQIGTNKSHWFSMTSRTWSRATVTTGTRLQVAGGGTSYDYTRQRILGGLKGGGQEFAWYNVATKVWTGIFNSSPWNGPSNGVLGCYHALRDVHVIAYANLSASNVRCQYIAGGATNYGAARSDITFTNGALPIASVNACFDCPDRGSFFLYSLSTPDVLYEVTVPANPANQWTWTARTITGTNRPSTLSPAPNDAVYGRMAYSTALKSVVWAVGGASLAPVSAGGRVMVIRVANVVGVAGSVSTRTLV